MKTKIRIDFVTNSSSSSYIICFARVADMDKARKVIEDYERHITLCSGSEILSEARYGAIGSEVLCAQVYGVDKVVKEHPGDCYILIEESLDADYAPDGEPVYSRDFAANRAIAEITEKNGFADIQCSTGEGRDG